ncbi:MAG: riboflavin synthase [Spirochaetes bacterium]|nr:riboflavin synthase [Spirochaetota bacterium]
MFTGIIDNKGVVTDLVNKGKNLEIVVKPDGEDYFQDVKEGSSIAVNGVCLTVAHIANNKFKAFVSQETLKLSNLKDMKNRTVNLEKSLRVTDRLDGHIVQGHVDGVATCMGMKRIGQDREISLRVPGDLLKYIVSKGSISINGVSLTVSLVRSNLITVTVIPETLKRTNLADLKIGEKVNVETDIIGRYIVNKV